VAGIQAICKSLTGEMYHSREEPSVRYDDLRPPMELGIDSDRKHSLEAMWRAYKIREGVGRAFMQARYQSPDRGQFLSEDPVFRGDPKQQNLQDPQSLNSYSYAVSGSGAAA
jgi:hypothetical protein